MFIVIVSNMLNASNTNKMNNIMSATFFSKTRVDRFFLFAGRDSFRRCAPWPNFFFDLKAKTRTGFQLVYSYFFLKDH
jgi:hypothetical protein